MTLVNQIRATLGNRNNDDLPVIVLIMSIVDDLDESQSAIVGLTEELEQAKHELVSLKTKLTSNRCNSGHETLPLYLWDCPECHNETKRELEQVKAERDGMRKALQFYADKHTYTRGCLINGYYADKSPSEVDEGFAAQQALAGGEYD